MEKKKTKKVTSKKPTTKKVVKKKTKKKGFTLIELLAVIIILGVLMIIAIPSVTSYIQNSRKSSYVNTAREIVSGARTVVNEGKLEMYSPDTTYYIPASYIKTENGLRSPYGEFTEAYVGVIFTGTSYTYYWISTDSTGTGVKGIIKADNLDEDDIETDVTAASIHETVTTTGIGNRKIIKILKEDGTWNTAIELANTDNNVSEEGGSTDSYYLYHIGDHYYSIGDDIEGPDPDNYLFDNYQDALDCTVEHYQKPGVIYNYFTRIRVSNGKVAGLAIGYYLNGNVHYLIGGDSNSYAANKNLLFETFGSNNCEEYSYNQFDSVSGEMVGVVYNTRCAIYPTSTTPGLYAHVSEDGGLYFDDSASGGTWWACQVDRWNNTVFAAVCQPQD